MAIEERDEHGRPSEGERDAGGLRTRAAAVAALGQPFIAADDAVRVAEWAAERRDFKVLSSAVFRLFTDASGVRGAGEVELARLIAIVGRLVLQPCTSPVAFAFLGDLEWDEPFRKAERAVRDPAVASVLATAVQACGTVRRSAAGDDVDRQSLTLACAFLGRPDLVEVLVPLRQCPSIVYVPQSDDQLAGAIRDARKALNVSAIVTAVTQLEQFAEPYLWSASLLDEVAAASDFLFDRGEWHTLLRLEAFLIPMGQGCAPPMDVFNALQHVPPDIRTAWFQQVDLCGTHLARLNLSGLDLSGLRVGSAIPVDEDLLFDPNQRRFFSESVRYHSFSFEEFCDDYGYFLSDPEAEAQYELVMADDPSWVSTSRAATDVPRTSLRKADLSDAILRGAILTFVDATSVVASGVDLRDADLRYADFRRSNLFGADLRGADLSHADLAGAVLGNARLEGAKCDGALVFEAELGGASLPTDFRNVTHRSLPAPFRVRWSSYDASADAPGPVLSADREPDFESRKRTAADGDLEAVLGREVARGIRAEAGLDWVDED